jgi:eukaryotic-like serine/threonine-protein kinase
MELVYVPAGEFIMGSADFYDAYPIRTVYLDSFWIDQTEVTNGMYSLCVSAHRCNLPVSISQSFDRPDYYSNPIYSDFPVTFVSWDDASTYCAWAGRRLPTEAEWEKAASWDDINREKLLYPWGNTIDCSHANYSDGTQGCVGNTTKVGRYPSGASPYGALDMAGNADEWVADWFDAGYYNTLQNYVRNPTGPSSGDGRATRGGSYGNDHDAVRADFRSSDSPADARNSIGFRCARSATP